MTPPTIVCPLDPTLLSRLRGFSVAPTVERPAQVMEAAQSCAQHECELKCVRLHTDRVLAAIPIAEQWQPIPLAIAVPGAGRVRELVGQRLARLRTMNLYVHLPANSTQALTDARILASLGIAVVVEFEAGVADWDLLSDLAAYALLGRGKHASIEPFALLATSYVPTAWNDCGAVSFDDPTRYLHVDAQGRVALSAAECAAQTWVADDVREYIESGHWHEATSRMKRFGPQFQSLTPCSSCPGWRVCLGRFAGKNQPNDACRQYAVELMELIDQRQARTNAGGNRWHH